MDLRNLVDKLSALILTEEELTTAHLTHPEDIIVIYIKQ